MATSVVILWLLSSRFVGRSASYLGALFLLVLPATSRYGHDARPYALSLMLVLLTVLCWADDRLVRVDDARHCSAVLLVLVGCAHLYALLIGPVLVVVSALTPRTNRIPRGAHGAGVERRRAAGLLPFAVVLVAQRAHGQGDPPEVTPANVAEEVLRLPVGVLSPPLAGPLALIAIGGFLRRHRAGIPASRTRSAGAVLATVWLGLPILVLCAFPSGQWFAGAGHPLLALLPAGPGARCGTGDRCAESAARPVAIAGVAMSRCSAPRRRWRSGPRTATSGSGGGTLTWLWPCRLWPTPLCWPKGGPIEVW